MIFATSALTLMGDRFILLEQWGLYALIVLIPMTATVCVKLNGLLQKRYGDYY